MMTEKFVDSLQFYDRDHLPKYKVHRLEKILRDNSQFKGIGRISRAAVPLTTWLKALLDYHKVIIAVDPLKKEHKTAEETLTNVRNGGEGMGGGRKETRDMSVCAREGRNGGVGGGGRAREREEGFAGLSL